MASRGKSAREIQEEVQRALRARHGSGPRYLTFLAGGFVGAIAVFAAVMIVLFMTEIGPFAADEGTGPVAPPSGGVSTGTAAPTPTLETPGTPREYLAPTLEPPVKLGRLSIEGLYCWYEDADSTERLRFGIYNPTGTEMTVRVPHGDLRVRPHSLVVQHH